jgi:formate dehydrogenase major subunit
MQVPSNKGRIKMTTKMINLTIDGQSISVSEETNIVEAAKTLGIEIPTLCHREDLKPFTSCFICVVELKNHNKLVPACSTAIFEGMEIETMSPRVRDSRKLCIELLLSEHLGDCLPPCQIECPANCDIKGYLHYISQGDFHSSVKTIKETMSTPSSIGRICPRPCESVCRRNRAGESASICSLKRTAGDADLESKSPYTPEVKAKTGKKIAIIGAGPAGLNAAWHLAIEGHEATIYEAESAPGGMLKYGIPEYRLPKDILNKEVELITNLGVNIQYNTRLGKDITIESLKQDGYQAILLAIGAWKPASMRVEGEDTEGVLSGIGFLYDVANGNKINIGQKVIVVGGGNTAIDAARTSLRLGAEVTVLYRRTRKEMPAEDIEIHASDEEGIKMEFLTAPTKIWKEKGKLQIECIKMQLGEPDESGRRRPVSIEGSEHIIEADCIISAIGQKVDSSYISTTDLALTSWGTIKYDEKTYQTNINGIFSAGDCVLGPYIAAAALGTGHHAAISIDQYINGKKVTGAKDLFKSTMGSLEDIPEDFYKDIEDAMRNKMPELEAKERINNFEEVELGFSNKTAKESASICLKCGCLKAGNCYLRELASEYGASPERWEGEKREYYVDKSHPELILESNKCILCGCCVRFSKEIKNTDVLGFVNRGFKTTVKPAFNKKLGEIDFNFAKELAEVCPSGAIALKTELS